MAPVSRQTDATAPAARRRSARVWAGCLGAGVLALSGCGSLATDSSLSAAQVRFVEVSRGAPETDFYVNGSGAAYGLGFESFTSYLPVTPGAASLSANRNGGGGQVLAAMQGTLNGGHQYTALLAGGAGAPAERLYLDQSTPAPAGQIALRILNETEGAANLSVYITALGGADLEAPAAVWNVAPGAATSYGLLPAGTSYEISATVTQAGIHVPVGKVTVAASSGAVRTVVFAGTATAGSHSNLTGFTLVDADAL